MITTAIGIGLAMTGGGAVGEALRGLVYPRAHLVPGLRRLVVESVSPRLRWSSLSARRRPLRSSALVGTLAPNALLGTGERLDSVADGYILVTRRAPSPSLEAELARRRIVTVTALDDEPLGAWLRRAGAVAAVVRPDFTVADRGKRPRTDGGAPPWPRIGCGHVAARAQAQGCGRRRPVDAVPAVPATTECSILQN